MLARVAGVRSLTRTAVNATRCFSAAPHSFCVDNPYTLEKYVELPYCSSAETKEVVSLAAAAQKDWAQTSLEERIKVCNQFMAEFEKQKTVVATDISCMMGKPLSQAVGEVGGMYDRVKAMIALAPEALAADTLPDKPGFHRKITKEPVGVVFVIAPWNYPLLTAVNCVVPALLAGNSVIIKHAERTSLCGDHLAAAFKATGIPDNVMTSIHTTHGVAAEVIANPAVGFVSFTGSVEGGRAVYRTVAQSRFIDATLELGGKDAAYVAADADLEHAVSTLVDGAFYNAGQSCCGIERVYVHASKYAQFQQRARELIEEYVMGDPADGKTSLGPMALPAAPGFLQAQVDDAVKKGAKLVTGGSRTTHNGKGRFFQPTLLANCTHNMDVMREETFGPILPIVSVDSEDQAVALMNDCKFGLTASIFTKDENLASRMAGKLEAGTVFMNRCDFLDPLLSWSGVKDSGKGCSLSKHGFRGVTRLKSYHFKVAL